jgi:hypothetical protein
MYLSDYQIAFIYSSLLKPELSDGKTQLERTSVLLRFFAHDSLCKQLGVDSFAVPADKNESAYKNRSLLVKEYSRWATVRAREGKSYLISELGKIDLAGARSAKDKIGNDFLTAQVKQAQATASGKSYPARPAPLLFLHGQDAPWVISKDSDWESSFSQYLSNNEELTRLVQFLFRNHSDCDKFDILTNLVQQSFTVELSDYLLFRINTEHLVSCDSNEIPTDEVLISRCAEDEKKGASLNVNNSNKDLKIVELISKRFLIFTGLSGSGKSRTAKQIALSLSSDDSQYHFAAVGPDWNNRDPLLGYPDGIHPSVYQKTPVLELLIRADKSENKNKPFFLILDEMNLSHVERYFADFLSAMESDEKISLYEGGIRGDTEPSIALPPNLFIIGTVNIDETTYQFSPKVLDRANVIEFKMDKGDVGKFFAGSSVVDDFGAMAGIAEEFVSDAKTNDQVAIDWAAEHPSFATEMEVLFKILQNFNGEFGFRTLKESSRYLYFHNKYSVIEDDNAKYQDAMDCIILQKLLPKLHGSRSKVEGILRALLHFCETTDRDLEKLEQASLAAAAKTDISLDQLGAEMIGHYKQSHHKLKRMCKKLHQDQFVSFADA